MKKETVIKLLQVNKKIIMDQRRKIDLLLSLLNNICEYGKQINDLKLATIIEDALDRYAVIQEKSKELQEEMKQIKQEIEEEGSK